MSGIATSILLNVENRQRALADRLARLELRQLAAEALALAEAVTSVRNDLATPPAERPHVG